jgi:hypothetical protein
LSASTSCKSLLAQVRRGEFPPDEQIRKLGETCAGEFFREVVEPLADSFDSAQAAAYERLMRAWIPETSPVSPMIPARVDIVYVLSRVTLGADIKIVSPILAAMKKRFPGARIVFVANRKSAELFESDPAIEHLEAEYPRTGPVSARIGFACDLHCRLKGENRIVVDPDSRMTQLGLIPVCEPENYFHFPSRTIGDDDSDNLTGLVSQWLRTTFGVDCQAFIAPRPEAISIASKYASVSLGVGENESKRVSGDFETGMIEVLGMNYETVWVDRGVGGPEAARVTQAVEESLVGDRVRFWEGSFAGFASIISQCDLYAGYDSAGQHAAAAAGVPLISIFAGAPSDRFRQRWMPAGHRHIARIVTDKMTPEEVLNEFIACMPLD